MKRKFVSLLLAISACVGLCSPAWAVESTFSDVPESHWAYEYIQRATDNGWVKGLVMTVLPPLEP